MLMLHPFLTYIYIRNLLWKSGLTIPIFLSMRKTCKIWVSEETLNLTIPNDFFIISKRMFDVVVV